MAKRGAEEFDEVDVAVGARIRIRRKRLGVSQQALAERIGVSFQQVQKYERGANRVSASMLSAIARALDCHPAALFGSEPEANLDSDLLILLGEDGAIELLQAFARIPDRDMRIAVISVANGLAGDAPARALKRARV